MVAAQRTAHLEIQRNGFEDGSDGFEVDPEPNVLAVVVARRV